MIARRQAPLEGFSCGGRLGAETEIRINIERKEMPMHMWRLRMIAVTVLVLIASGCGRSHPFIGTWRPPSSLNCDSHLAKIEFTETTVTVTFHVGFNGALDSRTTAVTYGRDGEFYVATPTVANNPPVKFRFNSPNIELDSGCILAKTN
jgi:hypothetical protein